MSTNTERFLERATAGLATDPELRLDVQAELRSHIEDKLAELGGEAHADEAVASLGNVVELAEEVSEANQRRLGWRNLARRILRFGLVPVSIVCALWFSGLQDIRAIRQLAALDSDLGSDTENARIFFSRLAKRTPHEQLLLAGDTSREGSGRYRTLWERNPASPVYFGHYISRVQMNGPPQPAELPEHFSFGSKQEWAELNRRATLKELAEGGTVDPRNSRYPLLATIIRARAAADLDTGQAADGKTTYSLKPTSRPDLDQAMADLLSATALPEYHCYHREMFREQLGVLGPPDRVVDVISRILFSAVGLPDLAQVRRAAQYSLGYAQLLIDEGREEEAIPFLRVPENLGEKVARDSSCLIEMLNSNAMVHMAWETVPAALHQIGREEEAKAAEQRLWAVWGPRQQWYDENNALKEEVNELIEQKACLLASQFFGGESRARASGLADSLGNGRFLESTVATQFVVSLLGILMLVAILLCLCVSLRWRWTLGSQATPLLLLPSWRDTARFVVLGVALPFVAFWAWTRWLPFSGHAYSLAYAGHRTAVEFLALAMVLLLLPAWLAAQAFRRRCAELDLPSCLFMPGIVLGLLAIAGLLQVAGFLVPLGGTRSLQRGLVLAGWGGFAAIVALLSALVLSLVAPRAQGRAVGTLSRSLIPVFAVAVLILGLVVRPLLHHRERHLLRADQILLPGDTLSRTRVEAELVQRLRKETLKAMAENPATDQPAEEGH